MELIHLNHFVAIVIIIVIVIQLKIIFYLIVFGGLENNSDMKEKVIVETYHRNGLKSIREISANFNVKNLMSSLFFSNTNFDDFYSKQKRIIDRSDASEINRLRECYKSELYNLNQTIKTKPISVGMKKFLKGKRKFICKLLYYSKQKIKEINQSIGN